MNPIELREKVLEHTPRIGFVLNLGAVACLALFAEAYRADNEIAFALYRLGYSILNTLAGLTAGLDTGFLISTIAHKDYIPVSESARLGRAVRVGNFILTGVNASVALFSDQL